MPLGLASTEGLGLAWCATAWSGEGFVVSGVPPGALLLRAGDGGAAPIRASATLDCSQTRQCQMRHNEPTEDDGLPRSAVFRCSTAAPSHRLRNLRQRCSDHEPSALVPSDLTARIVVRRTVSSESAASWPFSSRRQVPIPLEHCTACFARPNVRGEAGPTALRLARAVHHVPLALRGQGAMPLGLASTEVLGRAREAACGQRARR